jgi:hypothetical protein
MLLAMLFQMPFSFTAPIVYIHISLAYKKVLEENYEI